jgi:hypothetical protein
MAVAGYRALSRTLCARESMLPGFWKEGEKRAMPIVSILLRMLARMIIGNATKKSSNSIVKAFISVTIAGLCVAACPIMLCITATTMVIGGAFASAADGDASASGGSSGGGANTPVVALAKEIADHLENSCGVDYTGTSTCSFRAFGPGFPDVVKAYGQAQGGSTWESGNFQCVSLVRGAYSQAYPMTYTTEKAADFLNLYKGKPGWITLSASEQPSPGDVLVMSGGSIGYGHVAIVTDVDKSSGKVTFVSANASVKYADFYVKNGSPWGNFQIAGYIRPDFRYIARKYAEAAGIDPDVYERQIQQESGFRLDAGSGAGAQGIAQFMPATAKSWGVNDPWDPFAALHGSVWYMRYYLGVFHSYAKALVAYNAGPGQVCSQWNGCLSKPSETVPYVNNILNGDTGKPFAGGEVPGPPGQNPIPVPNWGG